MNVIHFEQHNCKKLRAYLDSYLSNELLVETTHEVLRHLETCPDCMAVLENRRRVKMLLKGAVMKESAPAALQEKIRKDIRKGASHNWPVWTLIAAAAIILIAASIAGFRLWDRAPSTRTDVVADMAGARILQVGLKDHVHCALDSGFANREFTEAEMQQRLGSAFFGLVAMVKGKLPGDYRVTVGHRCKANGREYVHLILKNSRTALSLVCTKKNGESFTQDHAAAVLVASGVTLYGAHLNDLEVAGFETRDYLAFIISDLSREENLQMASALAPQVYEFLSKLRA